MKTQSQAVKDEMTKRGFALISQADVEQVRNEAGADYYAMKSLFRLRVWRKADLWHDGQWYYSTTAKRSTW